MSFLEGPVNSMMRDEERAGVHLVIGGYSFVDHLWIERVCYEWIDAGQ